MRKLIITLLTLLALGIAQGAEPQKYSLKVGDFKSLQIVDDLNVVWRNHPDSTGMVTFACDSTMVNCIFFTADKNKLKIEQNIEDLGATDLRFPTITVYSSSLEFVENDGDSTVVVVTPPSCENFKAKIIGNGTIVVQNIHSTRTEGSLDTGRGHLVLNGLTREVKLKNIGTGRIEAGGLLAESGNVTILGTGPVDCNVKGELTVKGMGTGKVYVLGNPTIKKRSIGSIKIINVD